MTLQHHSFGIALLLSLLARDGGCRVPTWRLRRSRLFSFQNPKPTLLRTIRWTQPRACLFPFPYVDSNLRAGLRMCGGL